MKRILIIMLIVLLASCNSITEMSLPETDANKSKSSLEEYDITEPVDFFSQIDYSSWVQIGNPQDRFKACEVPEETLNRMTTDALAESVLRFPMNYLTFAYDNPFTGMDIIFENSGLHRCLLKRKDAKTVLINKLYRSYDGLVRKDELDEGEFILSLVDELSLEYLIASDYFSGPLGEDDFNLLKEAVNDKYMWRRKHSDVYSIFSFKPLWYINENRALGIEGCGPMETKSYSTLSTTTLKTTFNQTIIGEIHSEMTAGEVELLLNYYSDTFPNAIVRGSSTSKYNGNSYAWYNSSIYNGVWIPDSYGGDFQISRYWTNDEYVECSVAEAEKAYYIGENGLSESSVVLPNGNFMTKWGAGPLMEHAPGYSPYDANNLIYFKKRTSPMYTLSLSGPNPVYKDEINRYTFTAKYPQMSYELEIAYMDSLEGSEGTYTLTMLGNNYFSLECHQLGLYKVSVYASHNGNRLAYGYINLICIGND